MCSPSCLVSTANILLILALLASILSYVAPYWIMFPSGFSKMFTSGASLFSMYRTKWYSALSLTPWNWNSAGLWAACIKNGDNKPECGWFLENDYYAEKNLPGWHKAVQGLFGAGIVILFLVVLLSFISMCCRCCRESTSKVGVIGKACCCCRGLSAFALGILIIIGSVCIGVALGLYGGYMSKDYDVSFEKDHVMFYWAFFVGIAGAALGVASAFIFLCLSCRGSSNSGYKMTVVV